MLLRKTSAGQAEVGSKSRQLPPRARSLLIMVDGKRSLDELRGMLGPAVDEAVALLEREGLVEAKPTEVVANRAAAPPEPPAAPASDLASLRREAARAVTEALGPMGDSLALRLERAKTWDDLKTALSVAAEALSLGTDRARAQAFRARFLPD